MNVKKKALGRGLSALLSDNETDTTAFDSVQHIPSSSISTILIKHIEANPFQPRNNFEEETLNELATSIKEQGIIQPITVRILSSGKYQLIAGERRLKASTIAGLTEIPAYIRSADDRQVLEMALVENIQRENLNPLEISISFQRLLEECNLTQEQLSERVGKNRSTVANYIRLLKLPAEIQIAIRDNAITMGHARALINIENPEIQLSILKNIIEKQLSVREVEHIVKNIETHPHPTAKEYSSPSSLPAKYENFKINWSQKFGRSIEIQRNKQGKGKISISFSSDEELDQIISIIE